MGQRVVFSAVYHYETLLLPFSRYVYLFLYWKPLFLLLSLQHRQRRSFSLIGIMFLAGVAYIVPGIKVILGS